MNIITDEKRIDEILERGVISKDGILPTKEEFRKKLMSGERLRFYIGADPTAKALHLGHAQNLILLEEFRKLGHEVIFLIGDFTAMIGDPTDKGAARVKQTREQVEENFRNWKEQTRNILGYDDKENPVQLRFNSEWLSKLSFAEVLELASNFTVQQMLQRDMFEKRMMPKIICGKCGELNTLGIKFENEKSFDTADFKNCKLDCNKCGNEIVFSKKDLISPQPIYLHEFLYPLMQGYDSVAMNVDVELCGTDQIFNALAGRTLLKKLKNKDKFVVSFNLIQDEKTGQLMSKSTGTGVFLDLDSNNLYGAVMAVTDGMIRPLFLGCTHISVKDIEEMEIEKNPRDAKMKLAFEIVKVFRGEEKAIEAQDYFVRTIQNKETPDEVSEVKIEEEMNIADFMTLANFASSKGDARRKIEQGGVSINGEKIEDVNEKITKEYSGKVMKVGKRNFAKIVF